MTQRPWQTPLGAVLVSAVIAGAMLYPSPVEGWIEKVCTLSLKLQNTERRIEGANINVECEWPHTPPWGNWGVESNYGRRYDGHQYQGWYPSGGWYQWNSCPVHFNTANHFNNGMWKQKGRTERTYTHASTSWAIYAPNNWTCEDIADDTVYTVRNSYMELWELDQNDTDDKVGKLKFPTMNARVTCSSSRSCIGTSTWTSHSSSSTRGATAKSRFQVRYTS